MTTRAASVLGLVLGVAAIGAMAGSRSVIVGQTFPIAEPDVMQQIKQQAAATDWKKWMQRAPAEYSAFRSMDLPRATRDDSRLFDPTYTLPDDIKDQTGKILFPRGTRVNVYTRIKVPGRYIVIGDRDEDFAWLREVARPQAGDKVLLAGGNVLTARQTRGVALFSLDDRFIERFGLKSVPAIVQQEGTQLRVREFYVARRPTASSGEPAAASSPENKS